MWEAGSEFWEKLGVGRTVPEKSVPKIIALTSTADTQCHSESRLRLVLMSAVITLSLDNPSHIQTNSGHDSRSKATLSPFLYP